MADPLISYIRQTLPDEVRDQLSDKVDQLEQGKFAELLSHPVSKRLLGHTTSLYHLESWQEHILKVRYQFRPDSQLVCDDERLKLWGALHYSFFTIIVAVAALQTFLQANVTGPPLSFSPTSHFPKGLRSNLLNALSVDGEAVYQLAYHVELLCFVKLLVGFSQDSRCEIPINSIGMKQVTWLRARVNFVHQKTLSDISPTLQSRIYDDLDAVDALKGQAGWSNNLTAPYLLEKAAIYTHHGMDKQARETLMDAAIERNFQFALTGILGKRTRYQEKETSQLVVLAKSRDNDTNGNMESSDQDVNMGGTDKPQNLGLNDDTLLERISFTSKAGASTSITDSSSLPQSLAELDPSDQPLLNAIDSITLLSLASSITNTRPDEGLTREETLPYAQRVLEGGSSNWQVYTQALLVRSRIEGYRSRTTERGLLQLQALVDQVVAETTEAPKDSTNGEEPSSTGKQEGVPSIQANGAPTEVNQASQSTFLPRAQSSESAPASDRLRYIYALATPFRWTLEAELATRWTSLGGIRSALEIYERLQMWPEAALCWAATEREDKAIEVIRRLLYDEEATPDMSNIMVGLQKEMPPDGPRLLCILGDLSTDIPKKMLYYEAAWEKSNARYSRAQRSLGRLAYSRKDFTAAARAYSKSLTVNALNEQAWFAMGCALLELEAWTKAADSFGRVVKLDDTDAEGWSNLAAALLRQYEDQSTNGVAGSIGTQEHSALTVPVKQEDKDDPAPAERNNPQQPLHTALSALKRAATLKHDSNLIWHNVLTIAMTLSPPAYTDALVAQRRVIELSGPSQGEKCIDVSVLEIVSREVLSLDYFVDVKREEEDEQAVAKVENPALQRGIPRMFLTLLAQQIIPLITSSARLWRLVSSVRLWQGKTGEALECMERAWRAVMAGPASAAGARTSGNSLSAPTPVTMNNEAVEERGTFEEGNESHWAQVVEATMELVDGYESLGPRSSEGGESMVLLDWKFKARSAIRGVLGRGKELYEDSDGMERLKEQLGELRG